MEVFSVFATLSLVDMISGPLGRVRHALGGVENGVASLGMRMGNLALAMLKSQHSQPWAVRCQG